MKKMTCAFALSTMLLGTFSPTVQAIAETNSVTPKETSTMNSSESTSTSLSQSSVPQIASNSTTSTTTISSQNQELNKAQEESQNDPTTTTVQNKNDINNIDNKVELKATNDPIDSWMPDKNLQKAVSARLSKDVAQITKEDVSSLTYLDASDMGISSLVGLEYATKLGFLNINDNNVSDLAPISHAVPENGSLNSKPSFTLYADNNIISDVSPLSSISSLYRVYLDNNQITDISSLAKSTFIYDLALNDNQISDVSYLSGITNLHKLSLTNNHYAVQVGEVKNINSLSKLTNLTELNLTETGINNLDFVKPLVNLEILRVKNNHITDISPISQLPKLSVFEAKNQEFYQADISITQKDISTGHTIEYPTIKNYDGSVVDLYQYDGSVDPLKWNTISSFNGSGTYNTQNNSILWSGFSSTNPTGALVASFKKVTSQGWEFSGNIVNDYSISKKATDIIINYVDEYGKSIPSVSSQIISGNIGDTYDASTEKYKLIIDGYTLDTTKLPDNATGTLSGTAQTVTYVYTKNPVKAADVTVKYVDANGNKISADVVKSGNIGDAYSTDQKAIEGYTFKEVQGSATGTFTDRAQTVTYVYTKNNVTPSPKPDDYSETPESSKDNGKQHDSTSENKNTLPQTGDNEGLSMIGMIFGLLFILGTTIMIIFKRERQD